MCTNYVLAYFQCLFTTFGDKEMRQARKKIAFNNFLRENVHTEDAHRTIIDGTQRKLRVLKRYIDKETNIYNGMNFFQRNFTTAGWYYAYTILKHTKTYNNTICKNECAVYRSREIADKRR
jgi:hypothetical protein